MNPDDVRKWLAALVADLRARHLLPVLALLVAAAIVVPFLLSKSGTPAQLASLPAVPSVTATAPSAAASTPRTAEPVQNYLTGPDHDPFVQPQTTTTSAATTTTVAPSRSTAAKAASGSNAAGHSTTTTKSTPTTSCPAGESKATIGGKDYCIFVCPKGSVPAEVDDQPVCLASGGACSQSLESTYTAHGFQCVDGRLQLAGSGTKTITTTTSYSAYLADVTIGAPGAVGTVYHHLARYALVPTDLSAIAVFLGVEASDRRTAVFWLAGGSTVTGGAECSPTATDCEFVSLPPGGAVYITTPATSSRPPVTYRLQYDSVTRTTTSGSYSIDSTGAALVQYWSAKLAPLASLSYSADTGLMTIDLGTSQPTLTH